MSELENEQTEQEEKTSFKQDLYYWMQALVVALAALILIFTLVGRVISVVGPSMQPTLHEGDLMLLQTIGYKPENGDVVVLRKESFMSEPIVKRIIATGGQHVQVDIPNNAVYVDGVQLDETYINEPMEQVAYLSQGGVLDVVVPEGSIYVMGDNRNHSNDSRDLRLGTVDEQFILGRAVCILFPFRDFGIIH